MTAFETDPIIAFFQGTGTDHAGRQHGEILTWSDYHLETVHDYIQWLFPLREVSRYNRDAPILRPGTVEAFLADTDLRGSLIRGFQRMASFYSFESKVFSDGDIQLDPAPDFHIRRRAWLTRGNHNYLRLTRILTSLRTLGCEPHAEALLDVLDLVYRGNRALIGHETYHFWCAAMESKDGPR